MESVKDRPNSNKSGTNKLKDGKNKKTKQLENTGKKDKDTDKNKHKKSLLKFKSIALEQFFFQSVYYLGWERVKYARRHFCTGVKK